MSLSLQGLGPGVGSCHPHPHPSNHLQVWRESPENRHSPHPQNRHSPHPQRALSPSGVGGPELASQVLDVGWMSRLIL